MKKYLSLFLLLSFSALSEPSSESKALELLKGYPEYSHKTKYSKLIDDIFLGYDNSGTVLTGIGIREFKSYDKLTGLLQIKVDGDEYVIATVEILDLEKIKDQKKKDNALKAMDAFRGKIINKQNQFQKVDAISGATRYQNEIFINFNLLTEKIIEEMKKNPDWQKKKTSP